MPRTAVVFYQEDDGAVPVLEWLDSLQQKVQDKCTAQLHWLQEKGHQLRRPHAAYLKNGIYELRAHEQHVNYRILYFFHQQGTVVLSHGITKERRVPPIEIRRAIRRKQAFERDPARHTASGERAS